MYLHDNIAALQQLVQATAISTDISQAYVYKDYFVCMALKEIVAANPNFVFKGGTALSKCYGVIDRFSEDVDLGLDTLHPSQGMRKKTKLAVQKAMENLSLPISNPENHQVSSRKPSFSKRIIAICLVVRSALARN